MYNIMKNQKSNVINSMMLIVLMAAVLVFSACESNQKSADFSNANKETIAPPSIDIHTASLMGNLEAIKQHVKAGTDLNQKDAYGSTPLIIAATFGKTEVAKILINAGADLEVTNNDGATALHSAAFLCRKEIVEILIENGANKNAKNNFGSNPRESVLAPFEQVKPIYDQFSKDLGPLGMRLDYDYVEATRPVIAELLK